MKTKHTPGPWYASKDERCIYAKLQTTDGSYVEPLIAQCSKITTSANANAVLIAAAPEMFEALVSIYGMANLEPLLRTKYSEPTVRMIMNQMENAINKAKGE